MHRRLAWALAIALAACAPVAHAEPVHLKFANFSPDSERTYQAVLKPFADAVNKEAPDIVQIDMFPNGALGRNPQAQAQMILDGVADIAWVIPGYTPGRFPDNGAIELPGLFSDLPESATVMTRLLQSSGIRGYDPYIPLLGAGTPPFSIHARVPVTKLSDLKGVRMRSINPTDAETSRALGAVPVQIPITEAAEALGRGNLDATPFMPSLVFDFGIYRVTKYDYFIRLGISPNAILLSRAKFDALPAPGQAAIRKYGGDWLLARYSKMIGDYNLELIAKMKADSGRTVTFPSDAELAQAQQLFQPVYDTWLAKDPGNPALLQKVRDLIAEYRRAKS